MGFTDPAATTAAQTVKLGAATIPAIGMWVGTAQGVTDEDGMVAVIVDGPDATTVTEDSTEDDANQPILCGCVGVSVADQQRVVGMTWPNGSSWVIGSPQGQPTVIGAASIEGGQTDITVVSTAQFTLTLLDCEVEILHPSHQIAIDVNWQVQSGGAANTLIGRVNRVDEDGVSVEIGRYMRSSGLNNTQTRQALGRVIDWAPEPGAYTYRTTMQASVSGFTVILNPGTTPLTAAATTVSDLGPLPTTAFRTE